MATVKKTNPKASEPTTAIVVRPEASEEEYRALKVAASEAQAAYQAAEDAFIEVETAEVEREPVEDPREEFIQRGAIAVAKERASAKLQAADRRLENAKKEMQKNLQFDSHNTTRYAEVAADVLRERLARTAPMGTIVVIPHSGGKPDHAGARQGAVRLIVENPTHDPSMTLLALRHALDGIGALDGDGRSYTLAWAAVLTAPVERELSNTQKARADGIARARAMGAVGDYTGLS